MFLAAEVSQSFTALDVLLIALNAVAPIAVTIWVKVVLYRRREAEDREKLLRVNIQRHADHARSSPVEMIHAAARSISGKVRPHATSLSSADRMVLRDLRKRAQTLVHQ